MPRTLLIQELLGQRKLFAFGCLELGYNGRSALNRLHLLLLQLHVLIRLLAVYLGHILI